ncbi:AAA family ATPase [Marinicella sp. S1101]|uniref:AAA family ATPase n=1 Tax=Marinicella marina TaxID=2996016 RepID=UPI002260BF3D|nr:AAA family ATPase [Marinicella marina]MCX7554526.1 AAA family ATPase [Marinicella marina]MDJ1141090.1 AAA family ATPase [Marinicella marina]
MDTGNKIWLKNCILSNVAPIGDMNLELNENDITVLNAVNGKGKTTLLSYIVDSMMELSSLVSEAGNLGGRKPYYRVAQRFDCLNLKEPCLVYLRFRYNQENIDYVYIHQELSNKQYDQIVILEDKIPFTQIKNRFKNNNGVCKQLSQNVDSKKSINIFSNNILVFFPSYRLEKPGYLNESNEINSDYNIEPNYMGELLNPVEVQSSFKRFTNWLMDVVLDLRVDKSSEVVYANLVGVLNAALSSKINSKIRYGIGQRNYGSARIQVRKFGKDETLYPTIKMLSSGEQSLLYMFSEIIRQGDKIKVNEPSENINGIVIIDEIDKHMHIKIQKEVLPKMFDLFPNVQFIISSHSPFFNLGLAAECPDRATIFDLENKISIEPFEDQQYTEVYELMVSENDRFKENYQNIKDQFDNKFELQVISEGKNIHHIKKAITLIDNSLLDKINLVSGCEGNSSDKQLKTTFEIISNSKTNQNYLFIWDCDSEAMVEQLPESEQFNKFCFQRNIDNVKVKNGIENLYDIALFSEELYKETTKELTDGGSNIQRRLDKNLFIEKINGISDPSYFDKFIPLIQKIQELTVNPNS